MISSIKSPEDDSLSVIWKDNEKNDLASVWMERHGCVKHTLNMFEELRTDKGDTTMKGSSFFIKTKIFQFCQGC